MIKIKSNFTFIIIFIVIPTQILFSSNSINKKIIPIIFDDILILVPQKKNTYYVSIIGEDTNNGKTEDSAWRTISYAANKAKAGDTIYIKAGEYTNEHIIVKNSGTSSNPIIFEGYKNTPHDNPSVNWHYTSNSLTLGLDSTEMPLINGENRNRGRAIFIRDKTNIIFRNMQITNYKEGILIYGKNARGNQIDNIIGENFGKLTSKYAGIGILITEGAQYNTIKNSILLNAAAQAFTINSNNNIITHCKAYGNDNQTGKKSATDYYFIISGNNNKVLNSYAERKTGLAHRGHGFSIKRYGEHNLIKNCSTKNISGSFVFRHSKVKNNTFEDITAIGTGELNTFGLTFRDGTSNNIVKRYHAQGIKHAVTFRETSEDGANTYSGFNNTISDSTFEDIIGSFVIYYAPNHSSGKGTSFNNLFKNITFDGSNTAASLFHSYNKSQGNSFENCTFYDIEKYSSGIQEKAIFINSKTRNIGFTVTSSKLHEKGDK